MSRYLGAMVTQRRVAYWASASNAVQGQEQRRLGALVLQRTKSVPLTDEEALPALLKVSLLLHSHAFHIYVLLGDIGISW